MVTDDWNTRPGFDRSNRVRDCEGWHFGLIVRSADGSAVTTVERDGIALDVEILAGQNKHEAAQATIQKWLNP